MGGWALSLNDALPKVTEDLKKRDPDYLFSYRRSSEKNARGLLVKFSFFLENMIFAYHFLAKCRESEF